MNMYVQKVDAITKQCIGVAEYTNAPDYQLVDVEEYKGEFYLKGFAPKPTLDELKAEKLAELNARFAVVSESACCLSSAGFEIDANDAASRAVSNLILSMEATGEETVQFCDWNNRFHEVSLTQLKTIFLDIIANTRKRVARKWALRDGIHVAKTPEELGAIDIAF